MTDNTATALRCPLCKHLAEYHRTHNWSAPGCAGAANCDCQATESAIVIGNAPRIAAEHAELVNALRAILGSYSLTEDAEYDTVRIDAARALLARIEAE